MVNLNYIEYFGSKIDSIPSDIAYLSRLKTLKISSTNDTLKLSTTLKYLKKFDAVLVTHIVDEKLNSKLEAAAALGYEGVIGSVQVKSSANIDISELYGEFKTDLANLLTSPVFTADPTDPSWELCVVINPLVIASWH